MADLNVDFLAEALERHRNTVPIIILLAAEAHLASLRAPKGELEEARAELGAWLVEHPGWHYDREGEQEDDGPQTWTITLHAETIHGEREVPGTGPTEAAAIRAALSRARGEGS